MRGSEAKVPLHPSKEQWHPSVLAGQIVVVTTVDVEGLPNMAPKSWITMAAFEPPTIAFGCHTSHTTFRNVSETGQFVVNIPGEDLADEVWALIRRHGDDRIRTSRLTLGPAQLVEPPIVQECRAHLECELSGVSHFGDEVFIFGTIVAGSIDESCLAGSVEQQYFRLRPIFFLEAATYGSISTAKRIGNGEARTEQPLYVVELSDVPPAAERRTHEAFLAGLRADGRLLLAGEMPRGLLYVVDARSRDEAEALARSDPLARAGARLLVRPWTRTF